MGLKGRPVGGGGGGCIAADDCMTASGRDAAPTLDTAAAPSMVAPAALKKVLRLFMGKFFQCAASVDPLPAVLGREVGVSPGERPVKAVWRFVSATQ